MTKFKKFIMKDLGWKLLSIAIAAALWFMVINIENPVESRTYSIPVDCLNLDTIDYGNYTISNYNDITSTKVSLIIRGPRMSLDKISQNRSLVTVTADFAGLDLEAASNGGKSVPIDVKLPTLVDSVYMVTKSPSSIKVYADKQVSVEKPVQIDIKGKLGDNYIMENPYASPASVIVYGIESVINTIDKVKVQLSLSNNVSKNFSTVLKPNAYDKNGNIVENVKFNTEEITVSVSFNGTKTVPLKAGNVTGNAAEGYFFDGITILPENIVISGSDTDLSTISEIQLPDINIESKKESFTETYTAQSFVPKNISVNKSQDKIEINIKISPEDERHIHILENQITIEGSLENGLKAELKPTSMYITISGSTDKINAVDEKKVIGKVDVSNLTPGEHSVPIVFELPEGVRVTSEKSETIVTVIDEKKDTIENNEKDNNNLDIKPNDDPMENDTVNNDNTDNEPR